MPVRLMSTGCWSGALDDSISNGKEHVQNNPCHPVQEVLGADAAHVEDAAHHDGHWQQLCAMIRGGSGRQLSTITDRRGDRSRNTALVGGVSRDVRALQCSPVADVLIVWNLLPAPVLAVWCMTLCPCRETAWGGSPTDDGTVNPSPIVHALGLGQLNCRRLCGRDGFVHDGFMGLASSLSSWASRLCACRKLSLPR